MAHLDPSLAEKLERQPDDLHDVIVRVNGSLDEGETRLRSEGFQIRRRLGLINGLAATAPGSAITPLAGQPWVASIEEDSPVHTL